MPTCGICRVCGDDADGQHFGADACRACAAFFRRTIAGKMKYVCRFENNCDINKTLRCMCRSCRLTKCLNVGMNPSSVQASRAPLMPPQARKPSTSTSPTGSEASVAVKREHVPCNITVIEPPPAVKRSRCSVDSRAMSSGGSSPVDFPGGSTTSFDDEDEYVPNQTGPFASGEPKPDLRRIIENAVTTYTIDQSTLPTSYPVLTTMVVAYQDLLNRRNSFFQRTGEEFAQIAEPGQRTFVLKNVLSIYEFAQNNRTEVEWIAAMLSNFTGYCDLPLDDKAILFKHFWIHFVILERTFDTFCTLDGPVEDNRMVLQNGDVFDVNSMEYDCQGICAKTITQINSVCHPWIRSAGTTMLNPMKQLRPVDIEIIFAFGFMLWNTKDIASQLSPEAIGMAQRMMAILYDELFAFYNLQMCQENFVRRISELMRLIGLTEKIASHRKEDIMLSSMFQVFKIDVFLNELFEFVHT